MTLVAWPSRILPLPQRGGVTTEHADLAARSQPRPGPIHCTERSRWPWQKVSLAWVMTDLQLAIFDAFWHHTLSHGVAWFTTVVRGEGGSDTPVELTARIAGGYEATMANGRWRVTAQAECDQVTQYTEPAVPSIIDTATLRYLVDSTPESPTDVSSIIKTLGFAGDLSRDLGSGYMRNGVSTLFGKRAIAYPVYPGGSTIRYRSAGFGNYEPSLGVTDYTFVCVFSYGDSVGGDGTYRVAFLGLNASTDFSGWHNQSYTCGVYLEHPYTGGSIPYMYSNGVIVWTGQTRTTKTDTLLVVRRKSGVISGYKNNVAISPFSQSDKIYPNRMNVECAYVSHPFNYRDIAFWDSALSDTDFDTLNTQLCTEYGVT